MPRGSDSDRARERLREQVRKTARSGINAIRRAMRTRPDLAKRLQPLVRKLEGVLNRRDPITGIEVTGSTMLAALKVMRRKRKGE